MKAIFFDVRADLGQVRPRYRLLVLRSSNARASGFDRWASDSRPPLPIDGGASWRNPITNTESREAPFGLWTFCLVAVVGIAVWLFGIGSTVAPSDESSVIASPATSRANAALSVRAGAGFGSYGAGVALQLSPPSGISALSETATGQTRASVVDVPAAVDQPAERHGWDFEPVTFAVGSSEIDDAARAYLELLMTGVGDDKVRLLVEGHTDSSGNEGVNQLLSERRAQAVVDFLVDAGFPAELLTMIGHGEARPAADNDTADGRAANRRVEISSAP